MKRYQQALSEASGHSIDTVMKSWALGFPAFNTIEAELFVTTLLTKALNDVKLTEQVAFARTEEDIIGAVQSWLNEEIWVGESK